MGLFPGSIDSPTKAKTYGPLPTHGKTRVALVLHTTESVGMPGFGDATRAPHYVYSIATRQWTMWAEYHDGYVGTLTGHTLGGHLNCQAFQVEIIGYSNLNYSPNVLEMDSGHYEDLARFYRWAREMYGIENRYTPTPAGGWVYGVSSVERMTVAEWDAFSGLTAHGAVPNTRHWDTGLLDLGRVHALSNGDELPAPPIITPPATEEHIMQTVRQGDGYLSKNDGKRSAVKAAQIMLAFKGFPDDNTQDGVCAADGAFGEGTHRSAVAFQNSVDLVTDGIIGPQTWDILDS